MSGAGVTVVGFSTSHETIFFLIKHEFNNLIKYRKRRQKNIQKFKKIIAYEVTCMFRKISRKIMVLKS